VHYKRGALELALTQFTIAVKKRPDNATLRYHLALCLHAAGRTGEAEQELERCLAESQRFPEYEKAEKLLGEIESRK
jgi:Flp pilus assembly protein TadD